MVLVALNMSGAERKVNFEMSKKGVTSTKSLVATTKSSVNGDVVTLEPYGVFIGQLLSERVK
jgi:hypothetical protein